jgi:hypothetical protein
MSIEYGKWKLELTAREQAAIARDLRWSREFLVCRLEEAWLDEFVEWETIEEILWEYDTAPLWMFDDEDERDQDP